MVVFLIILVVIFLLLLKFHKSNYRLEYDNWTFFEGSLGSGKTTMLTRLAISTRRRRIISNFFTPCLNFCLWLIPFYNIFRLFQKKDKRFYFVKRGIDIYSNFPIRINRKLWSYAVNKDVLNWLFKVNEDCILVLDEVGYLFPSEMKKTDPLYCFCMTWFRHATNSTVFSASQSLTGCNVEFRRKVNRVYHLSNMKKSWIPFLSRVQVRQAIISEDMNNVYVDDLKSRESNYFRFKFPTSHFRSRYGREYYKLSHKQLISLSNDYQETFDKLNLKNGDCWNDFYFRFE